VSKTATVRVTILDILENQISCRECSAKERGCPVAEKRHDGKSYFNADECSTERILAFLRGAIGKTLLTRRAVEAAILVDGEGRGRTYSPAYFTVNKRELAVAVKAQVLEVLRLLEKA